MEDLRSRPVLVVEDNPGDVGLIRHFLSTAGLESVTAASFAEAVGHMERGRLAAVLLDLRLPDVSPLEATARATELVDAPVVVLSGMDDDELIHRCLEAGAQDYIKKSELSQEMLVKSLRYALIRRSAAALARRLEIAERYESLGRIAAFVAHEVNNQAAALLASSEHARALVGDLRSSVDPEHDPRLRAIEAACEGTAEGIHEIAAHVEQLRLLGRDPDKDGAATVEVEPVIERACALLSTLLRPAAEVIVTCHECPPAAMSEAQLARVLVDLLRNAAEAIGPGHAEAHRISIDARADGDMVRIAVEDTGPGVPEQDSEALFQPALTLEEHGRGIGLALARGILRARGGDLTCEPGSGGGCRFVIAAPAAVRPRRARKRAVTPPVRPRRRVLLVDDQSELRAAMNLLLSHFHDVVCAESGADALDILARDQAFDAIISDVMMHEMNGVELAHAIERSHPSLAHCIALLSGGSFQPDVESRLEASGLPLVLKPARAPVLLDLIEELACRRDRDS